MQTTLNVVASIRRCLRLAVEVWNGMGKSSEKKSSVRSY
jgi:hypothetical protein